MLQAKRTQNGERKKLYGERAGRLSLLLALWLFATVSPLLTSVINHHDRMPLLLSVGLFLLGGIVIVFGRFIPGLPPHMKEGQNLTEKERDLLRFKFAVESATDAILMTTGETTILYVNPAWQKLTGYTLQEVLGKKANILKTEKTPKDVHRMCKLALTNSISCHSDDFVNRRKDGSEYNASITIYPVKNERGDVLFWVGIQRDITDWKKADKLKSEFVSLASHQLRTPITALRLCVEMLAKGRFGTVNEKQQELLRDASVYAVGLADTVHTMLNVSRVEGGTEVLNVSHIQLLPFLEELRQEHTSFLAKKKLHVTMDCPPDIALETDKNLLKEIVTNLISNAIRYTPEKGTIHIRATHEQKEILIEVRDSGYGIPAGVQDKIFQKFFRADNVRKFVTDGTGLGLYLVQSLVTMLGGRITFLSEENKGTTFSVRFPSSSHVS